MRKSLLIIATLIIINSSVYPCFDTYLFLNKGSMVYPYKSAVLELTGEYSVNQFENPHEDAFLSNGSFYYGLGEKFSFQLSLGSDEKSRDNFKLDFYSIKAVYNVHTSNLNDYTLDLMLQYRRGMNNTLDEIELSLPNIFRFSELTYVIHPVANYSVNDKNYQIGGHTGIFYDFNESGVIGFGAEYASPQSGSYAGERITKSEVAASIFLGAKIGNFLYVQNELAKGLSNSRDFGFALTAKFLI
ncbi:MAG: hypothetical protein KKB77_00545 [Bacteroidetes bacterium]|nr:hypothetical protein [Bacteroidota bacterium]